MPGRQPNLFKFRSISRLLSSAMSTLKLTDDGSDQTLTGDLGDLDIVSASGDILLNGTNVQFFRRYTLLMG